MQYEIINISALFMILNCFPTLYRERLNSDCYYLRIIQIIIVLTKTGIQIFGLIGQSS